MDTIKNSQAIGIEHGNCGSIIEAGLQNQCAVLSGEDSKNFRVRVLASETEIYKKYFRKDIAKKIAKLQIIAAVVIMISQIGTMCFRRGSSGLESTGMGIWTSCFTFMAAAFVLWTCKKITYLRLHLSMACHILSVVGYMFLLMASLNNSIPSLRYRLFDSYSSQDNNDDHNSYLQMNDLAYNSSTVHHQYPYNYNNNHYNHYNRGYSDNDPVSLLVVSFILTTVIAVLGLIQLILSIVMSVMTIRAMCSGRSNMEGKMFAMEIAEREDSVISMIIPQKQSKLYNGNTKENI